jgi:hypothetical protein
MKRLALTLGLTTSLLAAQASLADTENAEVRITNAANSLTLSVPMGDFQGIPGLFQDAVFTASRLDTTHWTLQSLTEGRTFPVDNVELLVGEEFPTQVFLRVSGSLTCEEMGKIGIDQSGNNFAIFVYQTDLFRTRGAPCLQVVRFHTKSIPLPVYGLDAGTYTYSVNGQYQGEFTLLENNLFAEDGVLNSRRVEETSPRVLP